MRRVPAPRPRALGAILAVVILATVTLAALGPGRARHTLTSPLLGRPIRAAAPRQAASSLSTPPRTVLQASDAFAAGYAAFLAGREPAAAVPSASGSLRARLALLSPRIPAGAISASSPRVTSVRVSAADHWSATSTAVIEDGAAIDPLTLRLARDASGWTVVDLAETG